MKLNSKRTFIIGLAFFSICAFWQMYDNIVPLILKYRYGISDGISGPIMALDNVLALFMLPLFGTLSDKKGARMPFIVVGTAGGDTHGLPFLRKDIFNVLYAACAAAGIHEHIPFSGRCTDA